MGGQGSEMSQGESIGQEKEGESRTASIGCDRSKCSIGSSGHPRELATASAQATKTSN